jgi:hypothetical protein
VNCSLTSTPERRSNALMKQSPLDREIRNRIDAFIHDVTSLVRSSALDAVMQALGPRAPAAASSAPAAPASKPPAKARGRRGKRSSDEVNAAAATLFDYISAHPGERLEQIGAGMGVATKELKLPVQKLFEAKAIRTEGQRRGTKYFAGGKRGRGRGKKA